MIPVAIAAFLLLLAVVYLIVRPFLAPLRYTRRASIEQLYVDRDRLRAQLRELDADFETGKLAPEDHAKIRSRRLQQIEAITRAIRDAEALEEGERLTEREPTPPALGLEGELERRIAERKRLLAALDPSACPTCATPTEPEDRFCRRCGADLATAEVKDR